MIPITWTACHTDMEKKSKDEKKVYWNHGSIDQGDDNKWYQIHNSYDTKYEVFWCHCELSRLFVLIVQL